jgi:hypothetical protein
MGKQRDWESLNDGYFDLSAKDTEEIMDFEKNVNN